jgi:GNAT superfamily N-acetyltransferase
MAGGLIGETYWNWLHIELLWLEEGLRGRGYGQRLVIMAEDEARRRGMKHAYLNTFSFQAPDFYERLGYQRFGTLEDFPPGHKRHYYRKDL